MKKIIILMIVYIIFIVSCNSYDYEKIFYKDTLYVEYEIVNNYELSKDTFYYIKYPYAIEENWKVFHDTNMKQLLLESNYFNDTCTVKQYNYNGKLKHLRIISKKGYWIKDASWYSNGQLIYEINYTKPQIPVTHYYSNGNKKLKCFLEGGYFVGEFKEWFKNGKLKTFGKYEKKEKKDGIWKYYKKNGELEKTEVYDNGKLIRTE